MKYLKPYWNLWHISFCFCFITLCTHALSVGILLDSNENSFGSVLSVEQEDGQELHRYPFAYAELKKKIAKFR